MSTRKHPVTCRAAREVDVDERVNVAGAGDADRHTLVVAAGDARG